MSKLPLSERMKGALVSEEGGLEDYLRVLHYYERGEWKGVSETPTRLSLNEKGLPECHMEAVGWADSFTHLQ